MIEKLPRLQAQERILAAAEQLFVEHGINATSMRDITQAAEVNLSSVNYYFGSKYCLTKALFLHYFLPYIQQCHLILTGRETDSGIDDIIDAILTPMRSLADTPEQLGIRLLCRISNEYPELVQEQIRLHAGNTVDLLLTSLEAQLPHLPSDIIRRRLFFVFKLLFYSYNGDDGFGLYHKQPRETFNTRHIQQELRSFIRAGLAAPSEDNRLQHTARFGAY